MENEATPSFLLLIGLMGIVIGVLFIKGADEHLRNSARHTPSWGTPPKPQDRWVFVAIGWLCIGLFGMGGLLMAGYKFLAG